MKYANVLVDIALDRENKSFDYSVPPECAVSVGSRVTVPFGKQNIEGFVLEIRDQTAVDPTKIKPITKVMDTFVPIKPEFIKILDPICDKFKLRKIDVMRLFIPSTLRGRKRARKAKNAVVRARETENTAINLTPDQQKAIDEISGAELPTNTFVLHGVTGSGKTEVYMNVIERAIKNNKTAIMLVPEIGLTPQVLGAFRARFGETVAILHSGLTVGERFDEWFRLFSGTAKIAIGARSAIFAPLENLGAIIIDEEHDTSYFAENNPRFCTHDIAQIRANYWKCPLILGSATPSITTMHRAKSGDYKLLTLSKRVNDLAMPTIDLIDMCAEIRAGNSGIFSREFLKSLTETITANKQAMIFLNRRGFSSSITCKNCGWVAKCEHCDVALVYHKDENQLKCHYCASRFSAVKTCPNCASTYLKFGATGTQKVVDELEKLFPNVALFRLDADTTKSRDELIDILDKFAKTKPAILVGTQMIAKGHHFPSVALVGIIDADNSLHFADFRAIERTYALITQVAGRCGRAGETGRVILQTYIPNHYVYRLAQKYDYNGFFDRELSTRKATKYPPFTTIVRVLVTGERDDKIKEMLKQIMGDLRTRNGDFVYLGAMKSPLGRIDDKFRYQILARFVVQNEKEMLNFIDGVIRAHQPKSVSVFLEINPQSLS